MVGDHMRRSCVEPFCVYSCCCAAPFCPKLLLPSRFLVPCPRDPLCPGGGVEIGRPLPRKKAPRAVAFPSLQLQYSSLSIPWEWP